MRIRGGAPTLVYDVLNTGSNEILEPVLRDDIGAPPLCNGEVGVEREEGHNVYIHVNPDLNISYVPSMSSAGKHTGAILTKYFVQETSGFPPRPRLWLSVRLFRTEGAKFCTRLCFLLCP